MQFDEPGDGEGGRARVPINMTRKALLFEPAPPRQGAASRAGRSESRARGRWVEIQ